MCQGHKNINIMYKNQCSMTKIGFKLTISPFDYQIFTAPLTEPLRVDIVTSWSNFLAARSFAIQVPAVIDFFRVW
jgi:hypothetical protein